MSFPMNEKKLHLLEAVEENNVDLAKTLLDSPEMYKITDRKGNNLLQLAIMEESFKVFDYLLSIQDFPLELENAEGHTALETALGNGGSYQCYNKNNLSIPEHFASELIRKGANIHRPTLLHGAIKLNFEAITRYLIENGVDLNEKDTNGSTPLDQCCLCYNKNMEVMFMLLCHGADPFVTDRDGNTPFYKARVLHPSTDYEEERDISLDLLENLFLCTYDEHKKYKISLDTYLYSRFGDYFNIATYSHFHLPNHCFFLFDGVKVSEYIDQIEVYYDEDGTVGLKEFLQLGPDNLALFIEKFPDVLRELLNNYSKTTFFNQVCVRCDDDCDCVWWKDINCEIFDPLIQSEVKSETICFISNLDCCLLMEFIFLSDISEASMTELICYFLSYGLDLHDVDLEAIYNRYGFCQLFRICLHMDLHLHHASTVEDTMPRLIIDVSADIQEYIAYPWILCDIEDLKLLLSYCADPKLQKYCRELRNQDLTNKLNKLPQVPLLEELARNIFRRHFIDICNITSTKQFFSLLKLLPISVVHKKIISFETKLYP